MDNGITAKIGMPRVIEMFSSQDMMYSSGERNKLIYWMLTPTSTSSNVNYTSTKLNALSTGISPYGGSREVRPVVTIDGSGLLSNPYIIE